MNLMENKTDPILAIFDDKSKEAQLKRHSRIGDLMTKAVDIIEAYLDDASIDISTKMLPVKLAADIYHSSEKIRVEDEKIELEKIKIINGGQKPPSQPILNQQNNFISANNNDLLEIKKKQDELLASFSNNGNPTLIEEDTVQKL